jgi:prenyl protein peptidase
MTEQPAVEVGSIGSIVGPLLLMVYAVLYVLPLYASPATRPSPSLSRDSPQVIRGRIMAASCSTILCSLATYLIILYQAEDGGKPLQAMGYWPLGVIDAIKAVLLTMILFAGPLYETLIIYGCWEDLIALRPLTDLWNDLITWRNLVVGPLTEEMLFRSASVPLLLASGMSVSKIVLIAPLLFGIAHVHHFYEFRITHPRVPVSSAALRSLLQLTYTSMFGAYATFLLLRTGSLLAIFLVHAFCNTMGLPRFSGLVTPHWLPTDQKQIIWSVIYYLLLVGGLVTWWKYLWALTESPSALTSFGS